MSEQKVSIIIRFLKSIEKTFTPQTELQHGVFHQVFHLEVKTFKHSPAPVATINEDQQVILPHRFA